MIIQTNSYSYFLNLKGSARDFFRGTLRTAVMLTLCHMASLLCVLKLAKPPQEKLIRFCSPHSTQRAT